MAESKADEIKKKVSIPMYFYNIIIPQMANYYSDYSVEFDNRPVAKCPLHDEDTPSMRYYEETNTFFCFGCRAGGDVIMLHRRFTDKMNGTLPSFSESVEFLYNFFIRGNESAQIIVKNKGSADDYKSSVQELFRFTGYCATLEGQILVDKTLTEESKRQLWTAMDLMHLLTGKNLVNAIEAMQYIKSVVKATIK